jgi:sugar transferase EpsL
MIKRTFDLIIATLLLVFLSPLLILVGIIIRLSSGKPVLFIQQRPGLNGKPFLIYKFRTMTEQLDALGNLFPDEMRLTKIGSLLRKASLDELPQLFNVLRGEMSLVGPRPLLMEYLPLYSPEQARRHNVKPGITGWTQVNGRNAISWEDKFKLDVWYVDNKSFWLDLKILWLTFCRVVKQEGISQQGRATADKFRGSKNE